MEEIVNLEDIYRKLKIIEQHMVTKAELNNALETFLVVSNEDTVRQIRESENDIKSGKVRKIHSIKEIV